VAWKLGRRGKTLASWAVGTPNQMARVAAYWVVEDVGDPAAVGAGVVGASEGELGEGSVEFAAADGAAKDEVVAAPGVVAAKGGVGGEGAAEVRHGKGGDVGVDAELGGGLVEGGEGGIELAEQPGVGGDLVAVGVEAAEGGEEDLAAGAKGGADLDDLGDLLELGGERVAGGKAVWRGEASWTAEESCVA